MRSQAINGHTSRPGTVAIHSSAKIGDRYAPGGVVGAVIRSMDLQQCQRQPPVACARRAGARTLQPMFFIPCSNCEIAIVPEVETRPSLTKGSGKPRLLHSC